MDSLRQRVGLEHDRWGSRNSVGVTVAAFVLGLLLGWWLLGWWLFPVQWTNAIPADLAEPWLTTYVQRVADAYASHQDVALARTELDSISPEALAGAASAILAASPNSTGAQHVTQLASALQIPLQPGATAAVASGVAPSGLARLGSTLQTLLLVLVAALMAIGLTLWWASTHWRVGEPKPAGAPQAAAEPATLALGPVVTRGRASGAPPWRPGRIDLGTTVTARFQALSERFFQTWLVYDQRGSLVGGAGLQAQPVGSVNTLVLWLRARYDDDDSSAAPQVTILAQAAYNDTVLRARLGDRNVIPAAPGQTASLETVDLVLDVQIRAVDPAPERDELSLRSITLSLTPQVTSDPDRLAREPEPPIPLPFRRD